MAERHESYRRDEGEAQRLDRNYSELLQELRVAQMGVQILFAFLLSIAFQQRFGNISSIQADIYLASLVCAAISAALFIAPVAVHRAVFREHLKDELVAHTVVLAVTALFFLALAMLGAIALIVDVAAGAPAAIAITLVAAAVFGTLWAGLPLRWRNRVGRNPTTEFGSAPE